MTAVLYALVFFTKGANSPKLGIDLQGGTQVTLTAQTVDGKDPSAASMQQAQEIMIRRVNGSGFAGVQVQIDGANHLVITVPGNKPLTGLYGSAKLNIRPDVAKGVDYGVLSAATAAATGTSGAAASGAATSGPAASGSASSGTKPSTPAAGEPTKSGSTSSATKSSATKSSAVSSAHGLRAAAPATVAATSSATKAAAPTTSAKATASAPVIGPVASTGSSAQSGAATSKTAASAPAASETAASGTAASGTATSAPTVKKSAWPLPGSDKSNPNQPAATTAAGWADWMTAAQTAVENGGISCADIKPTQGLDVPNKPLLACGSASYATGDNPCGGEITTACVVLTDQTLIPGDQIDSAAPAFDPSGSAGWVINVKFGEKGFGVWSSFTSQSQNLHKQTAFVLDGVVISDPQINGPINTVTTQISGSFTQQTATDLSNSLNFGALPLSFKPGTATSISAELGLQYLQAGLIAGGIGLLLVVVYCLIYYRLLGLITIGSLILSGGLVYAIMVLLGRWVGLSLDLSGVAGLIVAIGITADSFVIYFERLKDEVREGRSFRSAVPRGWERAKRTILSADAVSLLSAVILYLVAVGDVKGFAFTLGLSTILDLVVVYLVTHPLVSLASGSKIFNAPRFSGLGAVAAAGARQRAATSRLTAKEA